MFGHVTLFVSVFGLFVVFCGKTSDWLEISVSGWSICDGVSFDSCGIRKAAFCLDRNSVMGVVSLEVLVSLLLGLKYWSFCC